MGNLCQTRVKHKLSELESTFHAELYLTWCRNLLALVSRHPTLKRRAKGAARLAARSVRSHRGELFGPFSIQFSDLDFKNCFLNFKIRVLSTFYIKNKFRMRTVVEIIVYIKVLLRPKKTWSFFTKNY